MKDFLQESATFRYQLHKMRGLLLAVVLSLMAMGAYGMECQMYTQANGCSIPFNISFFYQDSFAPACFRHDACYGCGAHHGISRENCDTAFRQDMESLCRSMEHGTFLGYYACRAFAYVYYYAVDRFGGSHYYPVAHAGSACNSSWVQNCLSTIQQDLD